jgi:hypothetical protein
VKTDRSIDGRSDGDELGVDAAERFASEHPTLVRLAQVGWVAKGIVYSLTGVLALLVALADVGVAADRESEEASQSGAIAAIAGTTGGAILLWVLAALLVVYALWRFMTVALPAENSAKAWARRAGYAVSGVVYLGLAVTAAAIASSPGTEHEGEDGRVQGLARDFMEATGGRFLVGAVGVGLFLLAGVFLYNAVTAPFEAELSHRGVGPVSYPLLVVLGRIGWIGRAGMMALIGFFLTRAAIVFDPSEAGGLDGSLRRAAETLVGTALVFGVAVGLIVFGVFCIVSAPRQRLVATDAS